MKKLPSDPDYLPSREIPQMAWAINFSAILATLGVTYNIPQVLIDTVATNAAVILALKTNLEKSRKFINQLLGNKVSLLVVNPPDANLAVTMAKLPEYTVWPSGPILVGILRPFIQIAEILLADPNLTDADRTSFGLDKQPRVPTTRPSAEDFNYPLMSYTVKNGVITLRIKRGNRFRYKACQIVMSPNDEGKFAHLVTTNAQTVEVPVVIPDDRLAVTMLFQAIYMDGNSIDSDWSPILMVAVAKPNTPDLE